MFIEDKQYEFAKNLFVFANGKAAKLTDINMVDVLKVSGTDRVINSIVVDKGHGYIRLTNDEYFIGGWIEVGENLIKPIYKDMLLTVPEGEYEILITNKGYGGTKGVVVEANKETVVDVGDLKGDEVKTGKIIFTITPASATVEIDGKQVDLSSPVTLEYGIHQIVLQAEGYKTMTKYIKVGAALANMDIEMEEGTSSTSENTVLPRIKKPAVPQVQVIKRTVLAKPAIRTQAIRIQAIKTIPAPIPPLPIPMEQPVCI